MGPSSDIMEAITLEYSKGLYRAVRSHFRTSKLCTGGGFCSFRVDFPVRSWLEVDVFARDFPRNTKTYVAGDVIVMNGGEILLKTTMADPEAANKVITAMKKYNV